jgi:hypothetical protein
VLRTGSQPFKQRTVSEITFSADGRRLLVTGGSGTYFLDALTLAVSCRLPGFMLAWAELAAGGAKRVVVGSSEAVRVFDAERCALVARVGRPGDSDIVSASLSPDGRFVSATDGKGRSRIVDLDPSANFAFGCGVLDGFEEVPRADAEELKAVRARCASN